VPRQLSQPFVGLFPLFRGSPLLAPPFPASCPVLSEFSTSLSLFLFFLLLTPCSNPRSFSSSFSLRTVFFFNKVSYRVHFKSVFPPLRHLVENPSTRFSDVQDPGASSSMNAAKDPFKAQLDFPTRASRDYASLCLVSFDP